MWKPKYTFLFSLLKPFLIVKIFLNFQSSILCYNYTTNFCLTFRKNNLRPFGFNIKVKKIFRTEVRSKKEITYINTLLKFHLWGLSYLHIVLLLGPQRKSSSHQISRKTHRCRNSWVEAKELLSQLLLNPLNKVISMKNILFFLLVSFYYFEAVMRYFEELKDSWHKFPPHGQFRVCSWMRHYLRGMDSLVLNLGWSHACKQIVLIWRKGNEIKLFRSEHDPAVRRGPTLARTLAGQ